MWYSSHVEVRGHLVGVALSTMCVMGTRNKTITASVVLRLLQPGFISFLVAISGDLDPVSKCRCLCLTMHYFQFFCSTET